MSSPRLYATFLLWLLSELFEKLPEVGDPPKPKLVFFFDEAHLLFNEAPKELLEKVEQVVRLIRSKGVGVYFVTQNPVDVPDKVLAQLGNRVQHALRAFTPADQKAVKAAADTFRPNPKLNTMQVITQLGQGRSAGLVPGRLGHAVDGRSHHDPAAGGADRAGDRRRAQSGDRQSRRSRANTTRRSIRIPPLRSCRSGSAEGGAIAGAGCRRARRARASGDGAAARAGRLLSSHRPLVQKSVRHRPLRAVRR